MQNLQGYKHSKSNSKYNEHINQMIFMNYSTEMWKSRKTLNWWYALSNAAKITRHFAWTPGNWENNDEVWSNVNDFEIFQLLFSIIKNDVTKVSFYQNA